jgi:hypothetical protein
VQLEDELLLLPGFGRSAGRSRIAVSSGRVQSEAGPTPHFYSNEEPNDYSVIKGLKSRFVKKKDSHK